MRSAAVMGIAVVSTTAFIVDGCGSNGSGGHSRCTTPEAGTRGAWPLRNQPARDKAEPTRATCV